MEDEYKDNEKVLYKTKCKLRFPHQKTEEVDCLITENNIVIEAEEPIKVPSDRVEDCFWHAATDQIVLARGQPFACVVTLRYKDASGDSQTLELEAISDEGASLCETLKIVRFALPEKKQWRERWRDAWSREFSYQTLSRAKPNERDKLCAGLCAIGVDARIVQRGQVQEVVDGDWGEGNAESLGLVEIRHSPIRLVNVLKHEYSDQYRSVVSFADIYLVHDSTIPREDYGPSPLLYGRSVRVKSFPVFGQVVDLRWEGSIGDDGLMRLGQDALLNQTLIRLKADVEIIGYPECQCWSIGARHGPPELVAPSREQWDCYEL